MGYIYINGDYQNKKEIYDNDILSYITHFIYSQWTELKKLDSTQIAETEIFAKHINAKFAEKYELILEGLKISNEKYFMRICPTNAKSLELSYNDYIIDFEIEDDYYIADLFDCHSTFYGYVRSDECNYKFSSKTEILKFINSFKFAKNTNKAFEKAIIELYNNNSSFELNVVMELPFS